MSIIQCKDCGKDVSDQAEMCPNCGFPVAKSIRDEQSKAEQPGCLFLTVFLTISIPICVLMGYLLLKMLGFSF